METHCLCNISVKELRPLSGSRFGARTAVRGGQRKGMTALLTSLPDTSSQQKPMGKSWRSQHLCFAFKPTSWPPFFLIFHLTRLELFLFLLCYWPEFPSKHQRGRGVGELVLHLSLGETRKLFPILRSSTDPEPSVCQVPCWGLGTQSWGGPCPFCQGICDLVVKTPCLNSYRSLAAGLEGELAASSLSHSQKRGNGKTWYAIIRKPSQLTKC